MKMRIIIIYHFLKKTLIIFRGCRFLYFLYFSLENKENPKKNQKRDKNAFYFQNIIILKMYCFLIPILIYFYIYLMMLSYTIYKLNTKVNQINNLLSKELAVLQNLNKEKREKKNRKKHEKNISK